MAGTLSVMVPPELSAYAQELLADACQRFPLGYTPELQWRNLRVTAGTAYYQEGKIALSAIVLNTPERLKITLLHEYAHLLAYKRHGRQGAGHGKAWKQAMQDLGLPPDIRHNYEVARNKRRQQVVYACAKCGANFVRARKLPSRRRYHHVNCGGSLKLAAIKEVTGA